MKVLIVEDDMDMRILLKNVLAGLNIEAEEAPDGESAIRRIESGDEPDLVLLDLHLPGVDGWAVYKALREKTRSKIAVVTADVIAAPEFVNEADAVFVKPFRFTELIVKLTSLLAGAKREGEQE